MNQKTLGLINVTGEKSLLFLQGQLTADVNALKANRMVFAAHCNPKGRILCNVILFLHEDAFYLVTPRSMISQMIPHLSRYAALFRVKLEDCTNAFSFHFGFSETVNWEAPIFIGENSLLTPEEEHAQLLRLGFPWIYPSTSECFLPHELKFQETPVISFNKGCFTGQEIIARLHYKGHVKQESRLFFTKNKLESTDRFYLDESLSTELARIDDAETQEGSLLMLLCNRDLPPITQLFLHDRSVIFLTPLDE